MTVPEAVGRAVGAVLGALVMVLARPITWAIHEWDD